MQSVNGAQFVNTTILPLFPVPAASTATSIVPLTSINAYYNHTKLTLALKF